MAITLANSTKSYIEKCVLYVISALGACLSCVDLVLFVRTNRRREVMFLPLSRFAMWISIMLSSKFACACCVFASRILCFWWIFRFLTDALHLNMIFTLQVIQLYLLSGHINYHSSHNFEYKY
ncbi:hypothetical protein ARALYDRAFT_899465 [Arabidopsis lyrata subsp. lyrata]|uniref:Uncharacterized protein n=1 Tax=Arabidopsis lyrata subsp. lyrata TaxID=81972 RepID=D7LAA5_ARALL|nr:hypothetical protein ARALYDRAFT_899465 [Arabidopsis lyrata subsp. lyrata]